jgi:subtilisin family serine protease
MCLRLLITMSFIVGLLKAQESHIYTVRLNSNFAASELIEKGVALMKNYDNLLKEGTFFSSFLTVEVSDEKLLDALVESEDILYWEKVRSQELHFNPSDPFYTNQWYLDKIKAEPVWDFTHGDTSFVVGVVDSGVDYTHEDLQDNLAYNYDDPINGLDDDADGYIDNYYGWDFGSNDNDPMVDGLSFAAHGSTICGIVAASTDNAIGTSSSAFNCKYLPVKITDSFGQIIDTNAGIAYAAQMGVKVINCSFGSLEFSQAEADIIAYVTDSMDVLVVASAGNEGLNTAVYPAALEDVIGVCAVGESDEKIAISNYGSSFEISAPGESIYGPYVQDQYSYKSGTSVAAAVVSSAAILLRSYFVNESAQEIRYRIIHSTDEINSSNSEYQNQLGTGRLNLLAAFEYDRTKEPLMKFVPNPSNGEFVINFNFIESGNYQISVFDVLGKLYHREDFLADANVKKRNFDLDNLTQGYYTIQLTGCGLNTSSGIVIVK